MAYFPMGAIESSDFNSSRFPGVCKPTNKPTLDLFLALQDQLNRVLFAKKAPLIAVDGDIGPGTVKAVSAVLGMSATCAVVASKADVLASQVQTLANGLGAPAHVDGPKPARPPSIIDTATGAELAVPGAGAGASLTSAFAGMSTTTMLMLGAAVVGVGYYLTRKAK
jgi:hypothetical protein